MPIRSLMNVVDNQWPINLTTAHGPKICTSVRGGKKKGEKMGVEGVLNMLEINSSLFPQRAY